MSKLLTALTLLLTLAACSPEPQYDPHRPYQCTGIESSNQEDWKCTYKGTQLNPEEQASFNLNIKNGMKGREAQ